PLPDRSDAKILKVMIKKDLALLERKDELVAVSDGLPVYDPQNTKNADRFMVCGIPEIGAAFGCYPASILPTVTNRLQVTLSDKNDNSVAETFSDRGSPDPTINVYQVGPWDYLGPGLSGAPILDWYTGAVIAVIDGGFERKDGRHIAWAIPVDRALLVDRAWEKYSSSGKAISLAKDPLPKQLTSSDRSTPRSIRPLSPAERGQFRQMTTGFALGLLERYPCQWMQVGTELMNTLCGAKPCTTDEITAMYDLPVTEHQDKLVAVCTAIQTKIRGFRTFTATSGAAADNPVLTCDATMVQYWFDEYATQTFGSLLLPMGNGVRAQTKLIYNILWNQIEFAQRGTVLQAILAEWEQAVPAERQRFTQARTQFEALKKSCAPGGCDLGLWGRTTLDDWQRVSRTLFEQSIIYFSHATAPVSAACADSRIEKGPDGAWQFRGTGFCASSQADCYNFRHAYGLNKLAGEFAKSLRIDEPPLNVALSVDVARAVVDQPLHASILVTNPAATNAGAFQVALALPECTEMVSATPDAQLDSVARVASWDFDTLGSQGIQPVDIVLKPIDCQARSPKIELSAVARSERESRGESPVISLDRVQAAAAEKTE
ncbi:MAG TPA: hypothetical protein VK447_19945, partial [Myxococcaceae bacterium]|nr:hypothetical protein [Myxococcaceae bacterium]